MRKTAGFLKALHTIGLVFEIAIAGLLAFLEVFLLFSGKLSDLTAKADGVITVSAGSMTPAEMDALKPILLGVIGVGLLSMILMIIGTFKTRKALSEIKKEQPFSDTCVSSLRSAARIEVIGGIVSIAAAFVLAFTARNIAVNGTSVTNSTLTLNLTFIIHAVEKYMFYHITDYGRTLENN